MIKITRTVYCDACGCVISDYSSTRFVREYNDESFNWSDGADFEFCEDCTIAFNEWLKNRKNDKKAGNDDAND